MYFFLTLLQRPADESVKFTSRQRNMQITRQVRTLYMSEAGRALCETVTSSQRLNYKDTHGWTDY